MKPPKPENRVHLSGDDLDDDNCKITEPKTTGRYIVVFREDAIGEGLQRLELLGLQTLVADFTVDEESEDNAINERAVFFKTLGVAIVSAPPEKIKHLIESTVELNSPIVAVEPEKFRRALHGRTTGSRESAFGDQEFSATRPQSSKKVAWDESQFTWGLQATGVDRCHFSGRGIRVAILDTGLDLELDAGGKVTYHPDFAARTIVTSSFVPGTKTVKDDNSHGTHCTGSACGPFKPANTRRYGIAYNADIYVGKVLDDDQEGADGWIIAGIEWAINKRCHIISMALGWEKLPDLPYSVAFENVALRALKAGTLIMAGAGNDSLRPIRVCPIFDPAGCQSIMAVGAVDSQLDVATFSNGGIDSISRGIDIVAPGESIYSSYPMPDRYSFERGTSMAVSHVAGVAALYAEADPSVSGRALWSLITKNACPLPFPPQDVGGGLVKAP